MNVKIYHQSVSLNGLRVCYFGQYDRHYPRNKILAKCLKRAGAQLVELFDARPLVRRTPSLYARARRSDFDVLLVGFRAHADIFLARLIARAKRIPLVFDPLTSRYDERVIDRKLVGRYTPLARWYHFTDRMGCRLADRVLLETDAQIAFFAATFSVPPSKFRRLWLGADDEIMYLRGQPCDDEFTVFFYGRFGPLQGVEHVIRAASALEQRGEPARFVLVGAGQTYGETRALADRLGTTSVRFVAPVPYEQLPVLMSEAHLCLGIFGTTARAQRVIPNKVFDALATARPVVTADTPAIREALTHGENVWLCPPGDGNMLADAIALLKRDPERRRFLAARGYETFRKCFSLDALTRDLIAIVSELTAEVT